jgi:SAM-dependent methyltransferase
MNPGPVARLLNLPALLRHLRAHRGGRSVHDPADDLELALYGAIFGNDFLHYGYFAQPPEDAESISLADLKRAMDDYATLLVERVRTGERVLDVGCGMGGLLARLDRAGVRAVGVTPNTAHAAHIRARWPHIPLIESVFERLDAAALAPGFDAIVNAESFQYIEMDAGMRNVRALLVPGGRWIVLDYFRLNAAAKNPSGHLLAAFEAALARHGLAVVERIDVTENVLPTLAYGKLLATRFALPLARFASEKFFLRRPLAAYLFQPLVSARLDAVRLDTLDPEAFRRDKRYLLMTLRAS